MAMMTGDCPVVISVMGAGKSTLHQTNYTVKVPYSSMAQTIQVITKQGGKITNVTTNVTTNVVTDVVTDVMTNVVTNVMTNNATVATMPPSTVPVNTSSAAATVTVKPIEQSKKGFKPKKK